MLEPRCQESTSQGNKTDHPQPSDMAFPMGPSDTVKTVDRNGEGWVAAFEMGRPSAQATLQLNLAGKGRGLRTCGDRARVTLLVCSLQAALSPSSPS